MSSLDPAFIHKFYWEATELLHSSRHYMLHQGKFEMDTLSKPHGEYIEQEMARVATRMCGIVSWLLDCRESNADLSAKANSAEPRLKDNLACLEDSTRATPYPLPDQLSKLLHESRSLYLRIARLEDQLYKRHKKSARP